MNKICELCNVPARIFCDSDQATLCWDCDAQVHAANFLVARHSRTLLCHTCYSLTPWKASGARLGNTVSFCHNCSTGDQTPDTVRRNDGGMEVSGDFQPVPSFSTQPPAPASSEESVTMCTHNGKNGPVSESVTATTSLKRQHEDNGPSGRD
ncbi:hypothetical protein Lal_00034147 [Lupinus albus]|uniref:Putative transcription factor interactor and regulator Znf-B family n=1 Tax=Lupinus albus TaxID=3870 RepID=A0A6A4QTT7_LUPAL|nr:putative transcription factor interactor and regulator Znf-B family [Lupinus albus]KAF1896449.1 hypothetical protein Lal_00034147 [Lupinus albus]